MIFFEDKQDGQVHAPRDKVLSNFGFNISTITTALPHAHL
jgi:hypothetical protein